MAAMNKLVVYVTEAGKTPFEDWFNGLDTAAALRVRTDRDGQSGRREASRARRVRAAHHLWSGIPRLFW